MEVRHLLATATLCLLGAGCAHSNAKTAVAEPSTPRSSVVPEDATARLLSQADALVASGQKEAANGHLGRAREAFDAAVNLYLASPGGAYADARRSDAFRRTLEAIHVQEIETAAAGDPFREDQLEPASIDAVAELSVSEPPSDEARTKAAAHPVGDFPVELNDQVLACVDLYEGRLREWYQAALSRGQKYLPNIRKVFAEEGLPTELAYVALVESAFRPTAYSRAKARGVWQFISATGRRYGLQQDWWIDERSDPEKATRAAAKYLKQLYGLFGDWNLALAGYNAGEGKILRALDRTDSTTFWQIAKTRTIRRETKNYVPLIHAAILVARSPEEYGITVSAEPGPEFETTPIEGALDLRAVAECIGAPVDSVRELNPELRRLATPAGRTFDLRVPRGTSETLSTCLAQLPPQKRLGFRTHVVARGQTLASIARQNRIRARELAEANGVPLNRTLAVGTELIIPAVAHPPERTARAKARPASTQTASSERMERVSYRVRSGDTLVGIASQYGVSVDDIRSWNKLRGSRIAAGGTLTLYTTRKF